MSRYMFPTRDLELSRDPAEDEPYYCDGCNQLESHCRCDLSRYCPYCEKRIGPARYCQADECLERLAEDEEARIQDRPRWMY